ncbi:hypothetical protein PFISCL1PPCAC_6287 [Pristionchus fissidentatus]|uniref:Basement membrane proteoglycan n=1 Tax=Pristionchus fissidentatus TaxID=1538716 RepID=A0AAV5V5W4_9BILA|nr:hypothetical protein PFISCL1PPCAC_6287 [Pristionchus fissidentatus]
MPQRFLGNKVTSYGGKMELTLEYTGGYGESREPLVVLKGNQMILVHRPRESLRPDHSNKITIETYESNYEQVNGQRATREELLTVLADLDAFLIRASHAEQQTSTSLGDVSWQIAVPRDTGSEQALEVEQCVCPAGYIGTSCEDCAPGYERSGHGPYLGTCVPIREQATCSAAGAISPRGQNGRCECKSYTTGAKCDQCTPNSFYLAPTNPHGCIPCFCSGVTQQCQSTTMGRVNVELDYRIGEREVLELSTSDAHSPMVPQTRPFVSGRDISFDAFHEVQGQTLYWKLPAKFLGNKVTSYGGTLKYIFKYTGAGNDDRNADVIIRGNDITLHLKADRRPQVDVENSVEIKLFEDKFTRVDGNPATREHLLMALADLDSFLIKASYNDDCASSSLLFVSLEYAAHPGGVTAYEVEQCACPPGYSGTSCEDCSPGYSRTGGGLYLGLCAKCECNGHATACNKEYGYCENCQHNTEGDQCERCKPGFVGDARRGTPHDCQPAQTRPPCQCHNHSPRGCDSFGRCLLCEHSTEGTHCERCKAGYYGDATKSTPYDCTPCPCPGSSDCFLDSQGQVSCRNCPAGLSGRLCNECAPGYTRNTQAGRQCVPIGRVGDDRIQFVERPEAIRVQVVGPSHQTAENGTNFMLRCYFDSPPPKDARLEWVRVGYLSLPKGSIQSKGILEIPKISFDDRGVYRCQGVSSISYATVDILLNVLNAYHPHGSPPTPMVDPPHTTVTEGEAASFRCWVPNIPDCQITWHKDHVGGPLPHGVYQTGNALKIPKAKMADAGNYICTAQNQFGMGQSPPARLDVTRRSKCRPPKTESCPFNQPVAPRVDPPEQTVNEGEPARFRCWVPGVTEVDLVWTRPGGQPLPGGAREHQGILHIDQSRTGVHDGQYECTATIRGPEPQGPMRAPPVTLRIAERPREPLRPQVDPAEQTVKEGDPATFRCFVPGHDNVQIRWSLPNNQPLPHGVHEQGGVLSIPRVGPNHQSMYLCTVFDPQTRQPYPAPPATLRIASSPAPQVDPADQTVNEGEPAQIRCWVPGQHDAVLKWTRRDGGALPAGSSENGGVLAVPSMKHADQGDFTCTATDPNGGNPRTAPNARINVRQPAQRIEPQVDPKEQTIPEGKPFKIRCWVPGHPNMEVSWRKIDGELSEEADEDRGIVSLQKSLLSDGGNYVCSARDPSTGEPVDSVPALVNVKPSEPVEGPFISPEEQRVPLKDAASIKCWVPGDADADLAFFRVDGAPLPFGSSVDGGVLSIPSAEKVDEGDYRCVYTPDTPEGDDEEALPKRNSTNSKLIVVSVRRAPSRAPIASPPLQLVPEGQPVMFHCHTDRHPIVWIRADGGTLPDDSYHEGERLVIQGASYTTEGDYLCYIMDDEGWPVKSNIVSLQLTYDEAPTVRVEPRVWNGKPGDKHQFKCIVTGNPVPTIQWSAPGGGPLPHDVTEMEDGILDFSNGRSELNGDYTCTATNSVGSESDHGSVNIGPSLTVKTTPSGPRIIITVGEPLEVKCEAFGDPDPEVEWIHDPGPERGDLPDGFKPITISEQFIKHPSMTLLNAGVYTCKGSNSHATATKNIYIEVVEPSKVATISILGGSSQWFAEGDGGELTCTATGSHLIDRIEWVKVDDQLPTDVEEHNEPGLLHFTNFKKNYAGEYECRGFRNNELIASSRVSVNSGAAPTGKNEAKVDIEGPSVRVVNQGEQVDLTCSVEGDHKGTAFEWSHLHGGSLIRRLSTSPKLTIASIDPEKDYGVYRCHVEDDDGIVVGSAFTAVSVGFKKDHSVTLKFDDNSDADLLCPVYSVPGSKVVWEKDGGDIPSTATPNGGKLHIKEFDETVAGIYSCQVTIGEEVVIGYVHAQIFVPDTIIQVVLEASSESVNVGDRVWFDCKVTGDPDAQVEWVRDEQDTLPESAQVTASRLVFNEVTESDGGVYKCIARTKAGPLEARSVLNVGGKKKRKRNQRRRARHNRRHAKIEKKPTHSLFGSLFASS